MKLNFKEVNECNYNEVSSLSVACHQIEFIESNSLSLEESRTWEQFNPVALYDDETLIGFSMYGLFIKDETCSPPITTTRVWFDRLMIDEKFQNQGYGRSFAFLLLDHIFKIYTYDEIYLSVFEDNEVAIKMYQKLGFNFINEKDYGGEEIMKIKKIDFYNNLYEYMIN